MKRKWIGGLLPIIVVSLIGCGAAQNAEKDLQESKSSSKGVIESLEGEESETTSAKDTAEDTAIDTSEDAVHSAGLLPVQVETVYDSQTNEEGYVLINRKYQKIFLGDYVKGEFQKDEAHSALANALEEYVASAKEELDNETADFKEIASDEWKEMQTQVSEAEKQNDWDKVSELSDSFYNRYAWDNQIFVTRADEASLSFECQNYSYAGGAHPNTVFLGHNFDPETGKELTLEDVLVDPDGFAGLVESELYKQFPYVKDGLIVDSAEETIRSMLEKPEEYGALQWTLGYDHMTVYFSAYELAAYAVGPMFVQLDYADYPDLVLEKYRQTPDKYTVSIPSAHSIPVVTPKGDTKDLGLDILGATDEDEIGEVRVTYGDKQSDNLTNDAIYYEANARAFLLHNQDKNYVYVDFSGMDDMHMLDVVAIDDGMKVSHVENGALYTFFPYDPGYFSMGDRSDMFSTYFIVRGTWMDESGMPDGKDELYYRIIDGEENPWYTLTLKQDMDAMKVDESGKELEQVTLKKGDKLVIYRTDNKTLVDLKKDNEIYRFSLDQNTEEYGGVVNGVRAEDLFDGVMYAG